MPGKNKCFPLVLLYVQLLCTSGLAESKKQKNLAMPCLLIDFSPFSDPGSQAYTRHMCSWVFMRMCTCAYNPEQQQYVFLMMRMFL